MIAGFLPLYFELAGLIFAGGYAISSLFIPLIVSHSITAEQALLIAIP